MNCLSLARKRPASGKTKSADNPMAIWTKVFIKFLKLIFSLICT
jgi:hypothetical protein